jgi:hypothetical protein
MKLEIRFRLRPGASVQASLSRTFLHDGQIGLSLIARSTLSSNRAVGRWSSVVGKITWLTPKDFADA